MDETLFIKAVLIYKTLYPNLAPRFNWDGDCLLVGHNFIKTNSGPGMNCKSERAIKFCHYMHNIGVNLCPGLSNTALDFKDKTDS